MSRSSKSLTPARLNDVILGCFGRLQPSDTLDHLVRYLGTWSGSELRITSLNFIDYGVLIKYLPQQVIHGEACVGFRKTFLSRVLQVIQYAAKLIVPFLQLRARLQHRAGLRDSPKSTAAEGYAKLSSLLGDSRTLWRIWGQNFSIIRAI